MLRIKIKKDQNAEIVSVLPEETQESRNQENNSAREKNNSGKPEAKKKFCLVAVCDFFISASISILFLGLPLFFTGMTLQGLNFEKQIFFYLVCLIGLFSWILKAVVEGKILIRRTPLDLPILIFLGAVLASSAMSANKWTSFIGGWGIPAKSFVSMFACALFYWFMISNITKKRLKIALASFLISVGATCLLFISNIFSFNALERVFGMFGAKNAAFQDAGFNLIGLLSNLEIFISASILAILGILGSQKKGIKNLKSAILSIALFIILIACLFMIILLGGYISLKGLLAGMGIILALAMSGLVDMDKKFFSLNSLFFAFILVYVILGKPPVVIKSFPSEIGLSRNISWQIAKDAFRGKHLLGVGIGNFEYAFNKYKPKAFNANALWNTRFPEATGIFYESLATLGSVGTAAFILLVLTFLFACLYAAVKYLPRQASGAEQAYPAGNGKRAAGADILAVSLFAACVSLGIDMCFHFTGGFLIIYAVLMGSLAISAILLNNPDRFKERVLFYKVKSEYALVFSFALICLICGMIFLFISAGKIYIADVRAKEAAQSQSVETALAKINSAVKLFPYQYIYYEKLGDILALAGDKEMNSGNKDAAKAQSLLINAINSHKKALALAPESAFGWENLGVLSEAIVKYDPALLNDAEKAYNKAIELDPNNPALRLRLGAVKEAKADIAVNANQRESESESARNNNEEAGKKLYGEAIEAFEKAIELKSNLISAYDGVSRIKEKQGLTTDAINFMTVSYNLNANNVFYPFNLGRLYYNRAVLGGGADENDLKIAETLLKEAVQKQEKYVDALYSLGMLCEKRGMKKEAKEYYEQVLDILPADAEDARKIVKDKLESI